MGTDKAAPDVPVEVSLPGTEEERGEEPKRREGAPCKFYHLTSRNKTDR